MHILSSCSTLHHKNAPQIIPAHEKGHSGNPSCIIRTLTLCRSAAPLGGNKVHTRTRKRSLLIKSSVLSNYNIWLDLWIETYGLYDHLSDVNFRMVHTYIQSLLRAYKDCDVGRTCKPKKYIRDLTRSCQESTIILRFSPKRNASRIILRCVCCQS